MPKQTSANSSLGHASMVRPRIRTAPGPLPPECLAVYRSASASSVSDLVGRLWTMDPELSPLHSTMPSFAGTAVTVKAPPGDNWAIYGGLNRAVADTVLVVDWRGHTASCGGGEKAVLPALRRGLSGIVIDGAWRDVEDIAGHGLPVYGRGISPFSPSKRELGEVNVPVSCGGVIVEAGDMIIGDSDGIAVVPRRDAQAVAYALEAGAATVEEKDEELVSLIGDRFESAVAADAAAR